jgi:hypothetical protein
MIFVDYVFEKFNDMILMDKELRPESLGVKNDDVYRVVIDEDNRIIFVKVDVEE